MQHKLRLRSEVSMAVRDFLSNHHGKLGMLFPTGWNDFDLIACAGFVEVETPTLFKPTAEVT